MSQGIVWFIVGLASLRCFCIDNLAQADNSLRTGDFNTVSTQAESVLPIAQQITLDAQNVFWFTIAFTVIATFVFVLVLFLVWRWVKRSYIKNLSESKPEVVNDGT